MRSMIDDRGRLFGRLNVIDAALLAFVLILIPIGYTTVRLFQIPFPVIIAVAPASQGVGASRILVDGRDFRPYLRAVVSSPGMSAGDGEGILRLESPERLEVTLPALLRAGNYDLSLLDETREVARLLSAFTLVAATAPAVSHLRVDFRAVVDAYMADVMRVQDTDVTPVDGPASTLTDVRLLHNWMEWPRRIIEAKALVPVTQNAAGVWAYGSQPMRIGESFTFQTARYVVTGRIMSADLDSSLP